MSDPFNPGQTVPWWVILIIIAILLVILIAIPWGKISKRRSAKSNMKVEQLKTKQKNIENKNNQPVMGMYNWFGKKQAIRFKRLIYVQEEEDCCSLCLPFEGKVLSLADKDSEIMTMNEAISLGYHHIGCKHIDIDYFEGTTVIPKNTFNKDQKFKKHNNVLQLFKLEKEIRDIKYDIDNKEANDKKWILLKEKQEELETFCIKNNLKRNPIREEYDINDVRKFIYED